MPIFLSILFFDIVSLQLIRGKLIYFYFLIRFDFSILFYRVLNNIRPLRKIPNNQVNFK